MARPMAIGSGLKRAGASSPEITARAAYRGAGRRVAPYIEASWTIRQPAGRRWKTSRVRPETGGFVGIGERPAGDDRGGALTAGAQFEDFEREPPHRRAVGVALAVALDERRPPLRHPRRRDERRVVGVDGGERGNIAARPVRCLRGEEARDLGTQIGRGRQLRSGWHVWRDRGQKLCRWSQDEHRADGKCWKRRKHDVGFDCARAPHPRTPLC